METVGRTGEIVLGVKMMWIIVAFGSAFFAGVTSILAKCGIRKTDSTVATAIRTIVVLIFSWLMVFVVGSQKQIGRIEGKTLLFLVLSGLATGASWLWLVANQALCCKEHAGNGSSVFQSDTLNLGRVNDTRSTEVFVAVLAGIVAKVAFALAHLLHNHSTFTTCVTDNLAKRLRK